VTHRRLAILATHPVQYQCPLWARVAQGGGITCKVFFGSDFSIRGYRDTDFATQVSWGLQMLEGFDYVFTGRSNWHPLVFRGGRPFFAELAGFAPTDVLINAYLPWFYLQGLWWAGKHRVRVHFRGDTTDVDRDRGPLVGLMRNSLLRHVYSKVDTFCAVGAHSRAHYSVRGIDDRRIFDSPFCVDTDGFESLYHQRRPRRRELRASWNLSEEDFVLVFSGKLIAKKDPVAVIDALAGLPTVGNRPVKLLVAGDGPLRDHCEGRAHETCAGRVTFLGFTSQEDLASVYTAGDALVLPSIRSETWGLVVNEALQFGLPCVVSDRVGCVDDLILTGETGESFGAGNVGGLRSAIARLAGWLDGRRHEVAVRCRDRVSGYSLDAAAAGILKAVLQEGDGRSQHRN
jgi:glycosyltransferase involved in cell wall biosynthesis